MAIDAKTVKQLRDKTGAGMMDCKNALTESNGDLDGAVDHLRKSGAAKAEKKGERETKEGLVYSYIHAGGRLGVMIEVNCETDFVAKNEDFISFAKELSELNNINESDAEKLNKSSMKNGNTVEEHLVALIAKMGEKITIGRIKTFNHAGAKNFNYLHTVVTDNLYKLAVVVSLETKDPS